MKNVINYLTEHLNYIIFSYFSIQLILVLFYLPEFKSDSFYYFRLAQESLQLNSIYPAPQHLYEDFISAPLYINLTLLALNIYNHAVAIGILNIVLNALLLLLVFRISAAMYNKPVAKISVLVFILYLNTLGLVLLNLTELLFVLLLLLSIYFIMKEKYSTYFIAGVFTAASVSVRPLGFLLLFAFILYFFLIRKTKKIFRPAAFLITGFLISIVSFGGIIKLNFGDFVFMSTNSSYNLIIGANTFATGAYNEDIFAEGEAGLITDNKIKTYKEKSAYWNALAIDWIKENPVEWLSKIPLKIIHTFIWDDVSVSALTLSYDWNLFLAVKHLVTQKRFSGLFEGKTFLYKSSFIGLHVYHFIFYILFMVLIFSGFHRLLKNKNTKRYHYGLILLIFAVCNLIVVMIYFGAPRFKYPFLILSIPIVADKLYSMINPESK